MFLAVCFLLTGAGMVLSNPLTNIETTPNRSKEPTPDPGSYFWIMEEPRCIGPDAVGPNDKWLKHRNNNCYNCGCIGRDALCNRVTVDCPLTLSCKVPVIPAIEKCRCPYCESKATTQPLTRETIKITITEETPTPDFGSFFP
ncbi:uncharacterized protein LOC144660376 [Oculina patagonica]